MNSTKSHFSSVSEAKSVENSASPQSLLFFSCSSFALVTDSRSSASLDGEICSARATALGSSSLVKNSVATLVASSRFSSSCDRRISSALAMAFVSMSVTNSVAISVTSCNS